MGREGLGMNVAGSFASKSVGSGWGGDEVALGDCGREKRGRI